MMNDEIFHFEKSKFKFILEDERNQFSRDSVLESTREIPYHKKITLHPIGGWSLLKLIKFLFNMPKNFTSSKIQNTQVQDFHKKFKIFDSDKPVFDIYVSSGLEIISVKLIRFTPWILYNQSKHYYFVENKKNIFDSLLDTHPHMQFGRYFSRSDQPASHLVSLIYQGYIKKGKKKKSFDDLLNYVSKLPGYVLVVKQGLVPESHRIDDHSSLQQLIWIPPWAKERIQFTQYMELDASFHATSPYVYCCVNSICNNESVTIALSIGMSESADLYENAYCCLEKNGISKTILNNIPVLSDMGTALISFCEKRNIRQYFCHRHIIESFGNKTLRIWCIRILECVTESQYYEIIPLIQEEINIWISQIKDRAKVPSKINNILCMLDPLTCDKKYNFNKWGIWVRMNDSVARCSNHSESLHRVMNYKVGRTTNFIDKLMKITKVIIDRYMNQNNTHGRSIREKYHDLKNRFLYFKENMVPLSRFSLETCECGWNTYYSKIYGIEFPCIHQIGNEKFKTIPEIPPLIIPAYESYQRLEIIESSVNCKFEKNGIEKKKIATIRNDEINIHLEQSNLSPNAKYARREMWKVIYELVEHYKIVKEIAINIVLDEYLDIQNEDIADITSIAMMRVKCYMKAEKLKNNESD